MIKEQKDGQYMLSYENTAIIRRIMLPKCGVTNGKEWRLGRFLFEVFEEGTDASAELFLVTFDDELSETVERLGVGKRVKISWHVQSRAHYDSYIVSAVLDSISGLTESEDFIYGTKKKGE